MVGRLVVCLWFELLLAWFEGWVRLAAFRAGVLVRTVVDCTSGIRCAVREAGWYLVG